MVMEETIEGEYMILYDFTSPIFLRNSYNNQMEHLSKFNALDIVKLLDDHSLKVKDRYTVSDDGFCVRYDPSDQYLAVGCSNGTKHILNLQKPDSHIDIKDQHGFPITSLRWRPQNQSQSKVLVTVNSQGWVTHWHIPSGKELFTVKEENNSILCMDYEKTGEKFATGGKDFNIRIYDQCTKSVETTLHAAQWNSRGHSNRVFSVKFIEENLLISGGWDSVIHIWDLRTADAVRSIYGPHIAGDALDYQNQVILSGSHNAKDQIQLWDMSTGKLIESVDPSTSSKDIPYIYSVQFSKTTPGLILAGSSGRNQVRLFKSLGHKYELCSKIIGLKAGCYSVDFSNKNNEFAFTDASENLSIASFDFK